MLVGFGNVVFSDHGQVEIDVLAVLHTNRFAAGIKSRQVRVAVAMPVCHAAAPHYLSRVKQRVVAFLVSLELVEEVAELLNEKRVGLSQASELFGIAVVMRQSVSRLRDANIRDRAAIRFAADHAGNDARHIRPQCEHHQIKKQAMIFGDAVLIDVAREATHLTTIDLRLGHIQPGVGSFRSLFHLTNGSQVLVEFVSIF